MQSPSTPSHDNRSLSLSPGEFRILNEAVGLAAATEETREAWLAHVRKHASQHVADIAVMIWHGHFLSLSPIEHEAEKTKIAQQFYAWARPTHDLFRCAHRPFSH